MKVKISKDELMEHFAEQKMGDVRAEIAMAMHILHERPPLRGVACLVDDSVKRI